MITREEIQRKLLSKGCTLWGRAYDLSNEVSLEQATDFVEGVLRDFTPVCENERKIHIQPM